MTELLSPAELVVLRHIVAGERDKVIARALGRAVGTVKQHKASLAWKFDVDLSRFTLVKLADAGRAYLAQHDSPVVPPPDEKSPAPALEAPGFFGAP